MNKINSKAVDLNLLKVLNCLITERSTTLAAQRLHISQSAVSAALRRLRDTLGDPLFVREGNTLVPTPYAESIADELQVLLTRIDVMLTHQEVFTPSDCRLTFRVSASDFYADYLLPILYPQMQKEAPDVKVQLTPLDPEDHLNSLERFQTDVIIFLSQPVPGWMRSCDLMSSNFRIIASHNNTLIDKVGISSGEMIPMNTYCQAQHGLYSPSGQTRTWVDTEIEKIGVTRQIAATTSTFHGLAKLVSQSQLLATVPEITANDMAKHYPLSVYKHPLGNAKSSLMMAWHYRNHKKPQHIWFREHIAQAVRSL